MKKVVGIGINDSDEQVFKEGKKTKPYEVWHCILLRCYNRNKMTEPYVGCTICEEWKLFSNFKRWFNKNYTEGGQLDKDIIKKGNKVYSPETCCFVPPEINKLFTKRNRCRGNTPIGVTIDPKTRKFRASLTYCKQKVYLGLYNTKEEAFSAYKLFKEKAIKELADKYFLLGKINLKTKEAMYNYNIEITD